MRCREILARILVALACTWFIISAARAGDIDALKRTDGSAFTPAVLPGNVPNGREFGSEPGSRAIDPLGSPNGVNIAPTPLARGVADGIWQPLTVIGRQGAATAFDPLSRQLYVYGGFDGRFYLGDVMALDMDLKSGWRPLKVVGDPPALRSNASAVFDPAGRRFILYGGYQVVTLESPASTKCYARGAVSQLSFAGEPRWITDEPASGGPPERFNHVAIWDPPRGRMLVFGGIHHDNATLDCGVNQPLNDLWEWKSDTTPHWRSLPQYGDIPPAGARGTALYDRLRDRMLFVSDGKVWALSLGPDYRWSLVHEFAPKPSGFLPTALDPVGDRILVQEGMKTWVLNLTRPYGWTRVEVSGEPPGPPAEAYAGWDESRNRMFVNGTSPNEWCGSAIITSFLTFDSYTARWSASTGEATPGDSPSMVYDAERDRLLLVTRKDYPEIFGVVHQLSPGDPKGWSLAVNPTTGPSSEGTYLLLDAARDRLLAFGGQAYLYWPHVDTLVWELPLSGSAGWNPLPASASGVLRRTLGAAVYDPRRDRILFFGGFEFRQGERSTIEVFNDVWQFPLTRTEGWSRLEVTGPAPSPRYAHAAVYDPVRDQMIVVGGGWNPTNSAAEVWALQLAGPPRWTLLSSTGPSFYGTTLIHDPVRDRILAVGSLYRQNLLWAFQPARPEQGWTNIGGDCCGRAAFEPVGRYLAGVTYDPVRDAMIVTGGNGSEPRACASTSNTWAYTWGRPVRDIAVDVKPGSADNAINPGSHGITEVALLSEKHFDATTVDPTSVHVGSGRVGYATVRVRPDGRPMVSALDVNGDGRADLLLKIETDEMALAETDTMLFVKGRAPGNLTVRGTDHVRVVPAKGVHEPGAEMGADAFNPSARFEIRSARFDASSGAVRVEFSLRAGAPGTLELFDVLGRRLAETLIEKVGPGALEGSLRPSAPLAPGIYIVRLRQAGQSRLARFVALQ